MRFSTLCLGVAALVTLSLSVVQAQEIAAQEEWLETVKMAQNLEARHLRNALRSKRQSGSRATGNKRLIRRATNANDDLEDEGNGPIVLAKRVKGYPHRSEIQLRASFFKSFQADKLVEAPANLRVIKEVTQKPSVEENLRFERETKEKSTSTKVGKKATRKAAKKASNKKLEKRLAKKASSKKASKQTKRSKRSKNQ